MAPLTIIDIIAQEQPRLIHRNHTIKFCKQVDIVMPDDPARKD